LLNSGFPRNASMAMSLVLQLCQTFASAWNGSFITTFENETIDVGRAIYTFVSFSFWGLCWNFERLFQLNVTT